MRRPLAIVPLFMAILSAPVVATSDTVTVGGEVKPVAGTVLSLVNADTACDIALRDDAGRVWQEVADFELCFQQPSLVGRRVALTWTVASVQAAACGGDPDCSASDRIALISTAHILDAGAGGQTTLCAGAELTVFACRIGTKLVSVCAAHDASATSGYLQYRFGTPDSATPLELQVPQGRSLAAQVASGDSVAFAGGGAAWMRFRNGTHAYVVYSGIGNWGAQGESVERAGVVVEFDGKSIAALRCDDDRASGELGPDWFQRVGLAAKGEQFELPE